jgi:hypothetical protein
MSGHGNPSKRIRSLLPIEFEMARISMLGIRLGEPFCVPLPKCECKNGMVDVGDCWVDLGDEHYMVQGINPLGERVFVYGNGELVESVVAIIPPNDSTKVLLAMTAAYGLPICLSEDGNDAWWKIYDKASTVYRVVLTHRLKDGKDGSLSITMAM